MRAATPDSPATCTLAVEGMDCPSCAVEIEGALLGVPGVSRARVLLAAGRAEVAFDPGRSTPEELAAAVRALGYTVGERGASASSSGGAETAATARMGWIALALLLSTVLLAAIGEATGLLERLERLAPWWVAVPAVAVGAWPVMRSVAAALRFGRITSHTLLLVGVLGALAIGEWTAALLIVLFMRFADWIERITAARSRLALQELLSLRPATARVLRRRGEGAPVEEELPVERVRPGDEVLVRPGERIPVDGTVLEGEASVDQAPITGEAWPATRVPGDPVYAATIARTGWLRVLATGVGEDTTFGRIVRLVEEAEARKAPAQRVASRFAAWYLPVVLAAALLTLLVTGRPANAVSVLVVACACAIALATPVVVLASVGQAARQGVLIKGGAALEQLGRVDTLVVDKTGTLTSGRPEVAVLESVEGPADEEGAREALAAAAALEERSEHPVGAAIRVAAGHRSLALPPVSSFRHHPGRGVEGIVGGHHWWVGNRRLLADAGIPLPPALAARAVELEGSGNTVCFAAAEGACRALLAVADRPRPEAAAALGELRRLGLRRALLVTGDSEQAAAPLARLLQLECHAGLLPQDKIALVRRLQQEGAVVLMVGDGVNDAPALAQADVGVALGAGATEVALEAADVALLRGDWNLVPAAVVLGRRAVRTIRQNLAFTVAYNVVGIALAAAGLLPPLWAAAAHNVPDVAVMLNSGRLLRPTGPPPHRNQTPGEMPEAEGPRHSAPHAGAHLGHQA